MKKIYGCICILPFFLLAGCASTGSTSLIDTVTPGAAKIVTSVPLTKQILPTDITTVETPVLPTDQSIPTFIPPTEILPLFDIEQAPTPSGWVGFERQVPYLVFIRNGTKGEEIAQVDEYAKSGWTLPFPITDEQNMNFSDSLSNLISPDGQWMAFYSGSTNTKDLTLNYMRMSDGISSPIIKLLSSDYPRNFIREASVIPRSVASAQDLQQAFEYGITRSIVWSPDSRYLAFAGQMYGDSSDLYLWDTETGNIKQLSTGLQEMEWIEWSPNGKWIVNGSSYWAGEGMTYSVYATSFDGNTIKTILKDSTITGEDIQWLDSHTFLFYNSANGPGNYQLQVADIETGNINTLWKGSFNGLTVSKSGNWVVIYANSPTWPYNNTDNTFTEGFRIIDTMTNESSQIDLPDNSHQYTISDSIKMGMDDVFLMEDDSNNIYFLTTNGKMISTGVKGSNITVAPDQQTWATVADDIRVYTSNGKSEQVINIPTWVDLTNLKRIKWRPDSAGLFFAASTGQIYSVDFSSGDFSLVDDNWANPNYEDLIWVK